MAFWQFIVVTTLPWQHSLANNCHSVFSIPGHVIMDHVIKSFSRTTMDSCLIDKCGNNSSCYSINWNSNTGLCELNKATHLSYPEGLVASHSGASYQLYSLRPMVACSNRFCSDPGICLMNDDGNTYRCESCSSALGMHDGRILDSQLTASSYWSDNTKAWHGRIRYTAGSPAWIAKTAKVGEWLQVDLLKVHMISKIATQGRSDYEKWVTKYYMEYSQDGVSWESYKYARNVMEFKGNTDRSTVVAHKLPLSIQARVIRVVVRGWHGNHLAMRIELYGCLAS